MNLHEHKEEFEELIAIVADYIGVPADAVRRDYYIVQMMQNLQNSEYAEACVFKGGTSLSKCYPGSINRFSEDIDLILDWRVLGYGKDEPWEKRSNTKQDAFNKEVNARAEVFLCLGCHIAVFYLNSLVVHS